jgi:hypothetical protein
MIPHTDHLFLAFALQCRSSSCLARLDAGARGREHLAGAAATFRIKRRLQPGHHQEIFGSKELGHEADFFHANAVLAGDAAAAADAFIQNLMTGRQHSPHLVGVALIEQQYGVNVAVAGMENVADANLMLGTDPLNLAENVRQLSSRDDAVLATITRGQPPDSAKSVLARFP